MATESGSAHLHTASKPAARSVRWSWILAVSLGCLLGLLAATWLGETGARLGQADEFDISGME
jgi:predicted outer membrane lipoprotein